MVGIDDFSFPIDRSDVVLAGISGANRVDVVYPNGARATVLTAADGLALPTATAVHGTSVRGSTLPYCAAARLTDPAPTRLT